MLKVNSQDLKYVLVFALLATIITSSASYISEMNLPPSEQFLAVWILGPDGLAQNYYPNGISTLAVGEHINWTIGVYNHMGDLEYVGLRVKLLNSTSTSPDDLTATPSPAPEIFEFSRVLVANETWLVPFSWEILNLTQQGDSLAITGMSIDAATLMGNLSSATSGNNFRFIFELWSYDMSTSRLVFSWEIGGTRYAAWNQIWFNVTRVAP